MEACRDFIQWLGPDIAIKILTCLEDPSDLVRLCSVSGSWRQFGIENGLSKQLCLRMFPEISSASHVLEIKNMIEPVEVDPQNSIEWESMKRDLGTDHYRLESIQNTLESRDTVEGRASYWSSEGESDPTVPETLVYKLIAKLCVITEIHVQPFQAYFRHDLPIYSAKAVRFRTGHPRLPIGVGSDSRDEFEAGHESTDNAFIWTYTSPQFPMAQENRLQKFKLPEPVLCIGGILQIELLGRVTRDSIDDLYYICISHV
ncbi:hypothetical protein Vadar_009102 [Vaccinium darrowii]|uniref:Uncharacterized protein n=1 Tax=Vaccinium darrowii TaxID=229202 RepID=A0ACB7XG68_9ERIC|nr:hypothetical protein Vadar_009102 [Vaccinium darrowii]